MAINIQLRIRLSLQYRKKTVINMMIIQQREYFIALHKNYSRSYIRAYKTVINNFFFFFIIVFISLIATIIKIAIGESPNLISKK